MGSTMRLGAARLTAKLHWVTSSSIILKLDHIESGKVWINGDEGKNVSALQRVHVEEEIKIEMKTWERNWRNN